jgi:hypothetical protein
MADLADTIRNVPRFSGLSREDIAKIMEHWDIEKLCLVPVMSTKELKIQLFEFARVDCYSRR